VCLAPTFMPMFAVVIIVLTSLAPRIAHLPTLMMLDGIVFKWVLAVASVSTGCTPAWVNRIATFMRNWCGLANPGTSAVVVYARVTSV
jgi:hypothetical protein